MFQHNMCYTLTFIFAVFLSTQYYLSYIQDVLSIEI